MKGKLHWIGLAIVATLAACDDPEPVSVEQAMATCMEPARKASSPATSIGLGVDSHKGVMSSFSIEFTEDYLAGRNPDDVFEECVIKHSGHRPDRSYSEIVNGS